MFTKKKFLSLPLEKRHKHAARYILKLFQLGSSIDYEYRNMEQWLNLPALSATFEDITDRYHLHLSKSSVNIGENKFLSTTCDKLSQKPFGPIMIYLENLRSAYNIGTIIRTTEAFRLGTLIFSDMTPSTNHQKIKKTAMGTDLIVPSYTGSLDSLKPPLIALETCECAPSIYEFNFPKEFSLILGNEEYGVKQSTLNIVDYVVSIPLQGSKNSLNVANAYAIAAAIIKKKQL